MKTKPILLLTALALAIGGGVYGIREYFRGPVDSAGREASAILTPQQLVLEFSADEQVAQAKYGGKVIQVTGMVDKIEGNEVFLKADSPDSYVRCTFLGPPMARVGNEVSIKGVCSGVIILLGVEVQLEQCAIVE